MDIKSKVLKEIIKKYNLSKESSLKKELKKYFERMPEAYFRLSDLDDILSDYRIIRQILEKKKNIFEYKSDIEKFIVLKHDFDLLVDSLKRLYKENLEKTKLFRIYNDKNKDILVAGTYDRLTETKKKSNKNFKIVNWEKSEILKEKNKNKRIYYKKTPSNKNIIKIELKNISFITLIKNIFETIFGRSWSFVEIWVEHNYNKSIRSICKIKIEFFLSLDKENLNSIKEDLSRYLQAYIEPRSIFDIIGPAMVGPSSSHTAGANRIGQISRNILISLLKNNKINEIKKIDIKLIGSFRDTGLGHHTPEAIIGGLSAFDTDDENMISEGENAINNRKNFYFKFNNQKVNFGGFKSGSEKDDEFYIDDKNNNIAEVIAETKNKKIIITGFSVGGGNVEIRYINRKRIQNGIIDGKKDVIFDYEKLAIVKNGKSGIRIKSITGDDAQEKTRDKKLLDFNTFEEMVDIMGENIKGEKLIEKILEFEKEISGLEKASSVNTMESMWTIMKKAIHKGINNNKSSSLNLVGEDSGFLDKILDSKESKTYGDNIYTRALKYAIAVNEINAKSGLIVACPTGGSSGLLPSVLKSWGEFAKSRTKKVREKNIINSLFVAGFLGMILFDDVPTAGADLGCQAEIGGGAAMAAGALTFLEGGDLKQIIQAFTLALKNSMGLVCDPVAGLVEVPCVKRNGIYSSMAISASLMAIAGVESKISPDEVVLAVKEVGERMSEDYKETARGGLANTRDGKKIFKDLEQKNWDFFDK